MALDGKTASTAEAPSGGAKVESIFFPAPRQERKVRIALVGTYAPRKCGIATFSSDLVEQLGRYRPEIEIDIYTLDDPARPLAYEGVAGTIDCTAPESFLRTARKINESAVDAVWLQHEYGLFGGECGDLVLDFVDRLAAPLILTPHTVLSEPNEKQHRILDRLVERSSRIMTMSRHSRDLLAETYGAPNEVLHLIEHGAPDRPFGRQEAFKQQLGLSGRKVLMTFGLLGPGKGIEHVIAALPVIVERHPETIYRIVGATHPNLVASEGEAYRKKLEALVADLGMTDHVAWENRFLACDELLDQLEACDIYLTPYPNLQQSTSGTLSYAVALGKAVVSTPYLHARELLAGGAGKLVEPGSPDAIAEAVAGLLEDAEALADLQERAYAKGRETIWPRFAEKAAELVTAAAAPPARQAPLTATPGLSGVLAMSDGTGMLQHAKGTVPDRAHGYCLDDNARALMLVNVAGGLDDAEREPLQAAYAAFVQDAWNPELKAFRNFMSYDRQWLEDKGSEDSNGRALWALGHTVENGRDEALRKWARCLYDTALPHCGGFGSPRALAFAMLGAAAVLRVEPGHGASRAMLDRGADFLERLLGGARRPDWAWFETVLGYDNPRLSQALIEAGLALENRRYLAAGLETLEWIAGQQIAASGHFRPVGSDTFGHAFTALPFDQQPLEAQAAIEAARAAHRATGEMQWYLHACAAWNWFFGANDRGVVLADLASGRCRDGINPRGANENCGAESILAFQLSHYSMLALHQAAQADAGETIGERRPGHSLRAAADT